MASMKLSDLPQMSLLYLSINTQTGGHKAHPYMIGNSMSLKEKLTRGLACDSVGMPESIVGRTICVISHPGKMVLLPFAHWFRKHYAGRYRFARSVFLVDLVLIGMALGLGIAALILSVYTPKTFADNIYYDVSVAPREIITGAPSTLVIRYTNGTEEELRDVSMSLGYPEHFSLQQILIEEELTNEEIITIGTIPIGGTGSIKITGVMFGDVGGEQTFRSIMTFAHGEENEVGQKVSEHTFSPSASTLNVSLILPDQLIAFQEVQGTITYENTGEIDFPDISIEPVWPEEFSLSTSNPLLSDGHFSLPSIQAGQTGEMTFSGYLGDADETVTFLFHPSFTFGNTHYQQETLKHTSPVLPPQLSVSHTIDRDSFRPGAETSMTITYENIGETSLSNVQIGFETDSLFFSEGQYLVDQDDYPELAEVQPGATGEVTITSTTRSTIMQSEVESQEDLGTVDSQAIAIYVLGDDSGQTVTNKGSVISTPMTTPIALESFARYALPSGDQLGRGPLPPQVGSETKYWIFWHITGTINPLTSVEIAGTLPENVRFTGRQTVSQNEGVVYDESTNTISWTSDSVAATLFADSTIVGIAFEVGITPTDDQIATIPSLMEEIQITAIDETTGAFISSVGATISTDLPSDLMASDKAEVVE